ncbi:triose-phosphate isomerase family protein [Glycomyces sp. YM15]|uniref:triose-phosphate isomerase family protein n=1 Tax=Glycomyces sp. YM15 TaxID=2800446 RepID=UPI001966BE2E|nr:triose-phosphate isomerase family protein [Glycomyces sp. YM15]
MPLLIGTSLKLYFGRERTREWSCAVIEACRTHPAVVAECVEPFIVPSFLSIPEVAALAEGTPVRVGAQDVHWEEGPYTGEVSAPQLRDFGVELVEIGHAERRRLFGETDETVAKKVRAVLAEGLVPLLCIGEAERCSAAEAALRCVSQLKASLGPALREGLRGRVVVAYEPVWAIGAAEPAPEAHIRAVCTALRIELDRSGPAPDSAVIYGGSAGPGLLGRIVPAAQGLFLGRSAHDPRAMGRILDEALELT